MAEAVEPGNSLAVNVTAGAVANNSLPTRLFRDLSEVSKRRDSNS